MNTPSRDKKIDPSLDIEMFYSEKERTIHKFNPSIAEAFQDIPTALVLGYIEHFSLVKDRFAYITDEEDGTRSETDMPFYRYWSLSLGEFMNHFPFLKRDKIRQCIERLCEGPALIKQIAHHDQRFVDRKYLFISGRKTQRRTYRVNENYWDYRDRIKHGLDEKVANQVGVLPAAIFHNLKFTIFNEWDKAAEKADDDYLKTIDKAYVFKSPKGWRGRDDDPPENHPHRFACLRTITDAFELLEHKGFLERQPRRGLRKEPCWSIPKWAREQIAKDWIKGHPDYVKKEKPNILEDNDV